MWAVREGAPTVKKKTTCQLLRFAIDTLELKDIEINIPV